MALVDTLGISGQPHSNNRRAGPCSQQGALFLTINACLCYSVCRYVLCKFCTIITVRYFSPRHWGGWRLLRRLPNEARRGGSSSNFCGRGWSLKGVDYRAPENSLQLCNQGRMQKIFRRRFVKWDGEGLGENWGSGPDTPAPAANRVCPKGRKSRLKAKSGGGVLGEGQQAPSPPTKGLGELCGSPSGVRGGAPTAQRFPLFSIRRMASPDTIVLLIVNQKKKRKKILTPFDLESIIGDAVWCF